MIRKGLGLRSLLLILLCPFVIAVCAAIFGVVILQKFTQCESVWAMWVKFLAIAALTFYFCCALAFAVNGLRCMRVAMRAGGHGHEQWAFESRQGMILCACASSIAWYGALWFLRALWTMW